ncbi:MAG: hypothetical protein P8Y61_01155 [Gammaproteobacteria bacterium]|jgi:hypothetical protein
MNIFRNISRWQRMLVVVVPAATLFMFLVALWVPIRIDFHEPYLGANLFDEIRPRALLGTIAHFLRLGPLGFNYLKYLALFVWYSLIVFQVYQAVLARQAVTAATLLIYLALCFIFAFSTVTYMTYGPGFIDVSAYALVALAVIFISRLDTNINWLLLVAITILLLLAVLAHEKSVFDLAICFVWVLWKKSLRSAMTYVAPGILMALLFLSSVSSEGASGLQPKEYADILAMGFAFLVRHSLNVWGIVGGAGALWGLYVIFSYNFVKQGNSRSDAAHRLLLVSAMVLICLATLLIAADTNRMIGLMWLPVILLVQEVDINKIFLAQKAALALAILCVLQFFNPPILMYNHGVVPLNCYSLRLTGRLPAEADVAPLKMGPFGVYALSRPDLTRSLEQRCLDYPGPGAPAAD